MKLKDVQVGAEYDRRVSGRIVRVKVLAKREAFNGKTMRWLFDCVNQLTGRALSPCSAAKLRPLPQPTCEFCSKPHNRGTGAWMCPYCGWRFNTEG